MKTIWIAVLLLANACFVFAQTRAIDSMRPYIYRNINAHQRKEALLQALALQRSMNLDTLKSYIAQTTGLPLTLKERQRLELSRINYLTRLGQSDSALEIARAVLPLLKQKKSDQDLLVQYYCVNAGLTLRENNHKAALAYYFDALKLAEQKANVQYQVTSLNGVGWVYMEMYQYEEAIKWFRKSLKLADSNLNMNVGQVYCNMSSCYGGLGKIDSAKYFIDSAVLLSQQYEDYFSLANGLVVKSNIALFEEHPADAIALLTKAVAIRRILNDPFYILSDLCILSDIYASIGKTEEGLAAVDEAMAIARKYNLLAKLPMIYVSYETNYRKKGDFRKLSEIYEQHLQVKDSVYRKALAGELAELETRYDSEKKEKEIARQKLLVQQERNATRVLLMGMLGILVVIGATVVVYIQRSKAKAARRQFQSMLDAEQKERIRIARDLHDSIGQMLSVVKMNVSNIHYHASEEEKKHTSGTLDIVDKTIQEVRHISHNLIPEELNFGIINAIEELCGKINSAERTHLSFKTEQAGDVQKMSKQFELSLYRIVQEILSNMLKHAQASKIDIFLQQHERQVLLKISDNGTGFDASAIKQSKGLGWKNVFARINLLNGNMDVQSDKTGGTRIEIAIPQ